MCVCVFLRFCACLNKIDVNGDGGRESIRNTNCISRTETYTFSIHNFENQQNVFVSNYLEDFSEIDISKSYILTLLR